MKQCRGCHLTKDESEFYVDKRRMSTRARCKICCKNYQANEGKSGHLAATKRYQQTPSARQKALVRIKRYHKTPKGRLVSRQIDRRKRERKMMLDCQFTHEHVQLVCERFQNRCFNCGQSERLEIDHHYPLSKGFGLSLKNAVLLCKLCNASKHDKMPEDFYTLEQLNQLQQLLT